MPETGKATPSRDRSWLLLWLAFVIWLAFLAQPVSELLRGPAPRLHIGLTLTGVAVFAGVYAWATGRNARAVAGPAPATGLPARDGRLALAILCALGLFIGLYDPATNWLALFIFAAAYAASLFSAAAAGLAVGVIVLLTVASGLLAGRQPAEIGSATAFAIVTGIVTFGMVQSIRTGRELRAARQEIARLAVLAERERIARELHDLLGHNLSLITLKSELARRLIATAPERAAAEIADVEGVARSTLQEVRDAVANYRRPSLAGELRAAQEILAAAGIEYRCAGAENAQDLPVEVEAALAAAVREGVTNVIRYSRARQCTIVLTRPDGQACLEVVDDGVGAAPSAAARAMDASLVAGSGHGGSGLRGLAERVAALGGHLEAGPGAAGGFRLMVSIPTAARLAGSRAGAPGEDEKP